MIYFDTSYLVRLYFEDPGFEQVRELAATDHVCCAPHGQAETVAAFHRKFRERAIPLKSYRALLAQFEADDQAEAIRWLPSGPDTMARIRQIFRDLPSDVYLRGADALHLAAAAAHGLRAVYSNDVRFLAAAKYFGLKAENVILPS
ncbi:MAG TPA: PIN domain-containing protein [Opitutaceae bacterium]|nr:PIN domain-containing protein [Opitutaceae bacterium]